MTIHPALTQIVSINWYSQLLGSHMQCNVDIAGLMPAEYEVQDNMDTWLVADSEWTLCNVLKCRGRNIGGGSGSNLSILMHLINKEQEAL